MLRSKPGKGRGMLRSKHGKGRGLAWSAYFDDIVSERVFVSTSTLSHGKRRGPSISACVDDIMCSYLDPHILLSSQHHGKNSKTRAASKRLLMLRSECRKEYCLLWNCAYPDDVFITHLLLLSLHHGRNSKTRVSEEKFRRNSVRLLHHHAYKHRRGPRVWKREFRRGRCHGTR